MAARCLRRRRRDTVVHRNEPGKVISAPPTARPACALGVAAVGALPLLLPKPPPLEQLEVFGSQVDVGLPPKQLEVFGSQVDVGLPPEQLEVFGSQVDVGLAPPAQL